MESGGLGLFCAPNGMAARTASGGRIFLSMVNTISPRTGRGSRQRFAGKLVAAPICHFHRAQALVKIDGGLIPFQNRPTQRASALYGKLRHRRQQSRPDAAAPMRGLHKDVLQIDSRPPRECGEGGEIDGESRRLRARESKQRLRYRPAAEKGRAQVVFGGEDAMRHPLIFRQFTDEFENQRNVALAGFFDSRRHSRLPSHGGLLSRGKVHWGGGGGCGARGPRPPRAGRSVWVAKVVQRPCRSFDSSTSCQDLAALSQFTVKWYGPLGYSNTN